MNVFVLGTGRCGTTTLTRALSHCNNFTVAHESRSRNVTDRLDYPDNHIEVDNRLSWFLGSLHKKYPDAFYVHLTRDRDRTSVSYANTNPRGWGIVNAMDRGIRISKTPYPDRLAVAQLMVDTVTDNINLFLESQKNVYRIQLENWNTQFEGLWNWIGCTGDFQSAQEELTRKYNEGKRR
jgi:hypothetical protein